MIAARTHRAYIISIGSICLIGFVAGCGSKPTESTDPKVAAKLVVPGSSPKTVGSKTSAPKAVPTDPLHQTFKEATVQETPDGQWMPGQGLTKSGKSVGKLYEAVVAEWAKVSFTTAAGKKISYTATIDTDLGSIKLELWPEIAPNHVRNFVALARAGYYEGLAFDRAIKREEENGGMFESLEVGCPVGTGEPNYGSIGYWLKPEFSVKVSHEPGTIGAWHGEEVESAACKFYINLSKAQWMDGNFTLFGKVTDGLDVVQAIHRKPTRADAFNDRPVEPVLIRKVTISHTEARN